METKISKSTKIVLGILVAFTFLGLGIYLIVNPSAGTGSGNKSKTIEQVEFKKKGSSVTVNRSGQVTIKTPDRTIMQYWDKNKIDQLFAKLSQLDADRFSDEMGNIIIDLDNIKDLAYISEDIINLQEFEEIVRILEESSDENSIMPSPSPVLPEESAPVVPETYISEPEPSSNYSPEPLYPSPSDEPSASQKPFRCNFEEPEKGKENFVVSETVCSEMLD